MRLKSLFCTVLFLGLVVYSSSLPKKRVLSPAEEQALKDFLDNEYEPQASQSCFDLVEADWAMATDANEENEKLREEQQLKNAEFQKTTFEARFKDVDYEAITDPLLKRQMKFLTVLGKPRLDTVDLQALNKAQGDMEQIYNDGTFCPFLKPTDCADTELLTLDPEMSEIMASSRNYDELLYVWKTWRDVSGKKMRNLYKEYVRLSNKVAEVNGYKDYGEMWRDSYEDDNFIANVDKLWEDIKPLYNVLHKYVKYRLIETYKDKIDSKSDFIPAHLLGNMWAQSWINIYDLVIPYPDASEVDVTKEMLAQAYTQLQMFQKSDEFYKALGLEPNAMSYEGDKPMITKPPGRNVTCHASAWDFCQGGDFRIKMCTSVNMEDFVTVHHEMGHIQYFILYKDQPYVLRTGANPGFHEAVGDTIALSVSTPTHLRKIGLLKDNTDGEENDINTLMRMALERVAFMPFGLLMDKWRWQVFSGDVAESEWNAKWWKLREEYQKVSSPVERSEEDFDPGAKYHIPADSQYIAYFIAHVLEFQLHKQLCIIAGKYNPDKPEENPLHMCDIDGNEAAGAKLRAGLQLGASEHWTVALEKMTGETELKSEALLEYFKPLQVFLEKKIEEIETVQEPYVPTEVDQTIPIVVGAVLLAVVVIALGAWLFVRHRNSKKQPAA